MGVLVSKEAFNLRSKLNELNFSTVPYEKMPPGTVIQHSRNQLRGGSHLSTTSTSFVDMSFSVSITPRFSSSLLLIEFSGIGQQPNTHSSVSVATIYRNNATNLGDTTSFSGLSVVGDFGASTYVTGPINFFVYDEPETTQKVSYHLWGKTSSSGTAYISHSGVTKCLSVKEIKR